MSGRWANLALAALVPLATLSGVALFLVGSGPVWLVAVLHGGLGLGLLVLVPWKRPVVQRGLRRLGRSGREASILRPWLVLAAVLSGVAHLVGATAASLPVTTMQLHVTAGVVATVLTLVHRVQRPVRCVARTAVVGRCCGPAPWSRPPVVWASPRRERASRSTGPTAVGRRDPSRSARTRSP